MIHSVDKNNFTSNVSQSKDICAVVAMSKFPYLKCVGVVKGSLRNSILYQYIYY